MKPGKCYLLKHYFHQILQIIYFLLSRPENLFYTFFLLKSNCNQNHLPPPKTTYFTKPISDARHSISFIKASQNFAPSHANALILTLLILYLSLESPALKGQMALIIFTLLFTFNINFEAVIELEEINLRILCTFNFHLIYYSSFNHLSPWNLCYFLPWITLIFANNHLFCLLHFSVNKEISLASRLFILKLPSVSF